MNGFVVSYKHCYHSYYPDDTDDSIIWGYSLNSEEFEAQIPYLMDYLVAVAKWKNTEELQQFVAIERSKGNHAQMDIRAAFRVLRIEDTHMSIGDAALCRNFEWTFMVCFYLALYCISSY